MCATGSGCTSRKNCCVAQSATSVPNLALLHVIALVRAQVGSSRITKWTLDEWALQSFQHGSSCIMLGYLMQISKCCLTVRKMTISTRSPPEGMTDSVKVWARFAGSRSDSFLSACLCPPASPNSIYGASESIFLGFFYRLPLLDSLCWLRRATCKEHSTYRLTKLLLQNP